MWEGIAAEYGYWGLLAGVLIEGETFAVLAGIAAQQDWLSFPAVVAVGATGTFACNQGLFLIGRLYGQRVLERKPGWHDRVSGIIATLDQHQIKFVLLSRFVYGMRTLTPFALGISHISIIRYVLLDLAATATWALFFSGLGYGIGEAGTRLLGEARIVEIMAIAAFLILASALAVTTRRRRSN